MRRGYVRWKFGGLTKWSESKAGKDVTDGVGALEKLEENGVG